MLVAFFQLCYLPWGHFPSFTDINNIGEGFPAAILIVGLTPYSVG